MPFFFGGFGQGGGFDAHHLQNALIDEHKRVSQGVVALYAALCLMDLLRASFVGRVTLGPGDSSALSTFTVAAVAASPAAEPVRTNQLMLWHSATVEFLQHQCLASA